MYTHEEFRAFKSLEAYNFFATGWVKNVKMRWVNTNAVFICDVKHSYRVNDEDLHPWAIFSDQSHTVTTAHCTCIAGLGECCSHIAALLFYILFATTKKEGSVTDELAYWVLPSTTTVEPSQIANINFTKPRLYDRKKLQHLTINVDTSIIEHPMCRITDPETVSFLKELDKIHPNAAVLKIVKPFNEKFRVSPVQLPQVAPSPITLHPLAVESILNFQKLRRSVLSDLDSFFMLAACTLEQQRVYKEYILVDTDKACKIFRETAGQSNPLWYMYRQLRFTGYVSYGLYTYAKGEIKKNENRDWETKFENTNFNGTGFKGNQFTRNGQIGEVNCIALMKKRYSTFYDNLGFFINTECPWLGYSPDGILIRNNKTILVEVKTPDCGQKCSCPNLNCGRNRSCIEFDGKNVACLTRNSENVTLRKKHQYYGQIQLGLYILGLDSAILVLYSEYEHNFREFNVPYDEKFCQDYIKTLSELYFSKFLPFLADKKSTQLQTFALQITNNL